eukprot:253281-Prymnesium_polylepis.1
MRTGRAQGVARRASLGGRLAAREGASRAGVCAPAVRRRLGDELLVAPPARRHEEGPPSDRVVKRDRRRFRLQRRGRVKGHAVRAARRASAGGAPRSA